MLWLSWMACAGTPDAPAPAEPVAPPPMETPAMPQAPALSPSTELMAWLDANASTRVLLPFSVRRQALGVDGGDLVAEPPVAFRLDDSTMGVGLMDRLREECPELDSPCVVWLEGTYGAALTMPGLEDGGPVFAVTGVHGRVDGTPIHARFPE